MGTKVKLSSNIKAIDRRIRNLPTLVDNVMSSISKLEASRFIGLFQKHIEKDDISVEALSPVTIRGKELKGYDKPETPLYGEGFDNDNSYINMFILKKLKNGYQAFPRVAKHHKAAMQLRELLNIHEFGAIINKGGTLIRIPPRPVVFTTYREVLNSRKKRDNSQKVKRAINRYINSGNEDLIKKIKGVGDKAEEGLKAQ